MFHRNFIRGQSIVRDGNPKVNQVVNFQLISLIFHRNSRENAARLNEEVPVRQEGVTETPWMRPSTHHTLWNVVHSLGAPMFRLNTTRVPLLSDPSRWWHRPNEHLHIEFHSLLSFTSIRHDQILYGKLETDRNNRGGREIVVWARRQAQTCPSRKYLSKTLEMEFTKGTSLGGILLQYTRTQPPCVLIWQLFINKTTHRKTTKPNRTTNSIFYCSTLEPN